MSATPSHKNVLITLQGINPGNYTSGSKSVSEEPYINSLHIPFSYKI